MGKRPFRLKSLAHQSAMLLAALAVLVKAILPAGIMLDPERAHQGLSPIVLCSGHGPILALVDEAGRIAKNLPAKRAPDSDRHTDHPCTFAAMAACWTPSAAPASVAVLRSACLVNAPFDTSDGASLRLFAPPPPQTGPPLSA
jgi:hypothetical protein